MKKTVIKNMNVLSLFDGMSCGQIALNKLGIKYNNYFASEIDKYAIQVTQKNYPNTKQIGSVTQVKEGNLPKIHLLIGGSPCQSFSRIGDGSGFDGKSKLFWEFVRVLKETKPTYFLLENVIMKKEWEQVITHALGVEPIKINSKLLSAQNRERLYWTNIPNIEQPKQVQYRVKDFIQGKGFPASARLLRNPRRVEMKKTKIFSTLTAVYYKGLDGSGRPSVSIKEGELRKEREAHRMLTPNECEALQTVPKNYTDCVSNTQRYKMLGNGWTVDVIAHIFKNIPLT